MEISFVVNQAENTTIWVEIGLVAFGAVLGFVLSILTTIVSKAMDRHGKLRCYSLVLQPDGEYAVTRDYSSMYLMMTVWFEFQNSSNIPRVVRDVCLYLYKDRQRVARLKQIQYVENTQSRGHGVTETAIQQFGGEKNIYSFVLPPVSIQKQECCFLYIAALQEKEKYAFDEIRVGYYDERDVLFEAHLCDMPDGWESEKLEYPDEQKLLAFKQYRS